MPLRPGKHYPGTTIAISGDIASGCDPLDPSVSVSFRFVGPCGKVKTYVLGEDPELQHEDDGRYACDVIPDRPGRWHYQWIVKDGVAGTVVDQGDFLVQNTPFYEGRSKVYGS